jgi:hypothetical protein
MPILRAMAWARGWVSTRQARLCTPAGLDGSCQVISSFWRTGHAESTWRLWQLESAQEATPSCTPRPGAAPAPRSQPARPV